IRGMNTGENSWIPNIQNTRPRPMRPKAAHRYFADQGGSRSPKAKTKAKIAFRGKAHSTLKVMGVEVCWVPNQRTNKKQPTKPVIDINPKSNQRLRVLWVWSK